MRTRKLSRRQALRATGGLALALPLLSSLRARAEGEVFPKRLVLMYTPNGVVHSSWWPTNVTGEAEFDLAASHTPLAPYRDRLLLLKGVDHQVAKSLSTGGPHQKGIGGLFTARGLQTGTFVDGCGAQAGWADGISLDQEVANAIGQDTPLKSLELGVRALENDVQGRISYAGAGQPLPPMNQPLDVYDRLLSSPGLVDPGAADLLGRRKSVLDAVYSQFEALRPQVGTEDRVKLDGHLELVRDLERRMTATSNGTCALPDQPPVLDPASETDMPLIAELEVDLLAAAFACDLTRVATLQISTSLNRIRYPWLESYGEGHSLSHASGSATADTELTARAAWHAGLLARLCDKLAAIPEGEGSALDNTVMVWCSEISLGNTHSHTDMPFLLLGGGWHFSTGRYLELGGVSHSGLLVSILNAMGGAAESFGHPDYAAGPIAALG